MIRVPSLINKQKRDGTRTFYRERLPYREGKDHVDRETSPM